MESTNKDILILKYQYFPIQYNYQSIFPLLNLFWMIKIRAILLMCFMIENWENSIVAMTTSSPTGTLNFDDVSISLMNEELQHKLVTEN